MIVTAHITAEDIACGCHQASNCPGHLAISRLLKPEYQALVCAVYVAIQLREIPEPQELRSMSDDERKAAFELHTIDAPPELTWFVRVYDSSFAQGVEPTSFELDIPDKYLLEQPC